MARREREILEHAVRTIAEQGAKADELVDEAKATGGGNHPVTVHAKLLRLELLRVKADLERELGTWVLDCTACGMEIHWLQGISMGDPGHWGIASSEAWRAGRLTAVAWERSLSHSCSVAGDEADFHCSSPLSPSALQAFVKSFIGNPIQSPM